MPLIHCVVSFTLTWPKNWVITDPGTQDADSSANPPVFQIKAPKDATFKMADTKLYVPIVIL